MIGKLVIGRNLFIALKPTVKIQPCGGRIKIPIKKAVQKMFILPFFSAFSRNQQIAPKAFLK